jgi:hypothetical protein
MAMDFGYQPPIHSQAIGYFSIARYFNWEEG